MILVLGDLCVIAKNRESGDVAFAADSGTVLAAVIGIETSNSVFAIDPALG